MIKIKIIYYIKIKYVCNGVGVIKIKCKATISWLNPLPGSRKQLSMFSTVDHTNNHKGKNKI